MMTIGKDISNDFKLIQTGIENLREEIYHNRHIFEHLDIDKLGQELNSMASKLSMFGSYFNDGSLAKIYFDHNVSITRVVGKINEIIDHLKKEEM